MYILTGVPGSGKTFFAVKKIKDLIDAKESFYEDGVKVNFLILHDIEGLKVSDPRVLPHVWNADMFNDLSMTLYLNSLRLQYGLDPRDKIYIFVDEAQRYFPSFLKDPQIILFFDTHRHKGVELYLITQHEKKICFAITSVGAKEIRAVNTIVNPFGSFVYNHKVGGEQYATSRLKRDPAVFAMYKSFQAGEGKQEKSKLRYFLVALPLLAVVLAFLYFTTLSDSLKSSANAETIKDRYNIQSEDKPLFQPVEQKEILPLKKEVSSFTPETERDLIPKYIGPVITTYISNTDSLRYKLPDSDFDYVITVKDFLNEYPSSVYGYGYIHVRNKFFRLTTTDCSSYIFPAENKIYKRTFINSTPVTVVKSSSKPPFPIEFFDKSELPDHNGYRRSDYERIYLRQRGFELDDTLSLDIYNSSSVDLTEDKP